MDFLATSLGVIALGGLAVLPPIIFPKYFRSVDENWLTENRQIHRFLTNSLVGVFRVRKTPELSRFDF